ncbi:MAG TPA: hypothetical protein VEW95_05505 [Candidatus Limnocylindrales bacterium]|nr:hypothetical protein [Candidatus Limnocylindrales bacterium]
MTRRRANVIATLAFLAICLVPAAVGAGDCEPEPSSIWAPAGWVCPPVYGTGTASSWPGPGAARNDCTYPWTACEPIVVTSLDTGLQIIVTPVTWCHCWTGVTGPNGETARIVDLDPASVAALGLDPADGLWRVSIAPFREGIGAAGLPIPDTAVPGG